MGDGSRFSPEVKERAVRLVLEQVKDNEPTWPIIVSVATKIGCTVETLIELMKKRIEETIARASTSRS